MTTCRNTLDAWRAGTAYRVLARSRYEHTRRGLGIDSHSDDPNGHSSNGSGSNGYGSNGSGSNGSGVDSRE